MISKFLEISFFIDINISRNSENSFLYLYTEKKSLCHIIFVAIFFVQKDHKINFVQCITNRVIKICSVDCLDEEL